MKELKLTLTVSEINTVLKALGNLPYLQVFDLVQKIQLQANGQLSATEEPLTKNESHK